MRAPSPSFVRIIVLGAAAAAMVGCTCNGCSDETEEEFFDTDAQETDETDVLAESVDTAP